MASIPLNPISRCSSILQGDHYRLTILTEGLIRYEWSDDGVFEDRSSTFAINRNLPTPKFEKIESEGSLEVLTSLFHLEYDKKPFSPSGLTVLLRKRCESHVLLRLDLHTIYWV